MAHLQDSGTGQSKAGLDTLVQKARITDDELKLLQQHVDELERDAQMTEGDTQEDTDEPDTKKDNPREPDEDDAKEKTT